MTDNGFFIPDCTANEAENLYHIFCKRCGGSKQTKRIYAITFKRNNKIQIDKVGKRNEETGYLILAIIETEGFFYTIIDDNMHSSLMMGKQDVRDINYFM